MALEVPSALEGERLDRTLATLAGVTRQRAKALVELGLVSVSGRPARSGSSKVRAGQTLVVRSGPGSGGGPARVEAEPEVAVSVVYSDEDLAVVDKPAGMVVHPGAGKDKGTLVGGLLARFGPLPQGAGPDAWRRPGVVHRLDKGTSGLLVVALNARALAGLSAQFARRSAKRSYLALTQGTIEGEEGLVEAPLGRSPRHPTRRAVVVGGRPARTRYRVLARLDGPKEATLVECHLDSGRTHQIRVHLAAIGHPLVGDPLYGGPRWPELEPGRVWLHAARLELNHPTTEEAMSFSSPLPPDLRSTLSPLGLVPPGQGEPG